MFEDKWVLHFIILNAENLGASDKSPEWRWKNQNENGVLEITFKDTLNNGFGTNQIMSV